MKIFRGERTFDAIVVTVDGAPLAPRRDLHAYSENHFEWGYEGAESSQLALAILACCTDDNTARRCADSFMREIVANFGNEWEINTDQVHQALADLNRVS